jgi:SNF2 family DNA or RNA helicase
VGLGQNLFGAGVIKYYELRNHRVLVLCPKKLRDNWTVYLAQNNSELNPFLKDRFAYTVLSHTDLSVTPARGWHRSGNAQLGQLRSDRHRRIAQLPQQHQGQARRRRQLIRKSRYERLMDDIIQAGVKTKVLLLSATPVNNDLKDLRNQIYFVTEGRDRLFAELRHPQHQGHAGRRAENLHGMGQARWRKRMPVT